MSTNTLGAVPCTFLVSVYFSYHLFLQFLVSTLDFVWRQYGRTFVWRNDVGVGSLVFFFTANWSGPWAVWLAWSFDPGPKWFFILFLSFSLDLGACGGREVISIQVSKKELSQELSALSESLLNSNRLSEACWGSCFALIRHLKYQLLAAYLGAVLLSDCYCEINTLFWKETTGPTSGRNENNVPSIQDVCIRRDAHISYSSYCWWKKSCVKTL